MLSSPFFDIPPLCSKVFLRSFSPRPPGIEIVSVYGIWKHLPQDTLLPRLYLYIGLSVFAGTSCLHVASLLYRNGIFSGGGCPRAIISSHVRQSNIEKDGFVGRTFRIRLILPRPVNVRAGQYV